MKIPCKDCITLAICKQKKTVTCPIVYKSYTKSEHRGGAYYLDCVATCLDKYYWYWLDSDEIMLSVLNDGEG